MFFFFNDTATTEIYTLSLHDALPISRCNNPRNLQHFKLLGIMPAVSATDLILNLIEHEVPGHGLVHLLDLPDEQLEIIEVEVVEGAPAAGRRGADIKLPAGSPILSVLARGEAGLVPQSDPEFARGGAAGVGHQPARRQPDHLGAAARRGRLRAEVRHRDRPGRRGARRARSRARAVHHRAVRPRRPPRLTPRPTSRPPPVATAAP